MSESSQPAPERTPSELGPYRPNSQYEVSEAGRPLSHAEGGRELLELRDTQKPGTQLDAGREEAIVTALTDRYVPRLSDAKTPAQVEALLDDAAKQGLVSFDSDGSVKALNNSEYTRPNADGSKTKWTIDGWYQAAAAKRQTLHDSLKADLSAELGVRLPGSEPVPYHEVDPGETVKPPGPTTEEVVEAHAMHSDMSFAVGQAKKGRLEVARQSVAEAHKKAEEALEVHREQMHQAEALAGEAQRSIQQKLRDGLSGTEMLKVIGDPTADREFRDQLAELIGRSAEPVMVKKYDNVRKEQRFTELVYTTAHSNLAYVERYTREGQLITRSFIATKETAFVKKGMRGRSRAGKELAHALIVQEAGLLPSTPNFDGQRKIARRDQLHHAGEAAVRSVGNAGHTLGVPGVGEREASDRPASTYNPVVQRMESLGYDDATIGAVTRGKAGKKPRRRGFWGSLFGN